MICLEECSFRERLYIVDEGGSAKQDFWTWFVIVGVSVLPCDLLLLGRVGSQFLGSLWEQEGIF